MVGLTLSGCSQIVLTRNIEMKTDVQTHVLSRFHRQESDSAKDKRDLDPDALGREIYNYIRRSPVDDSLTDRNILDRFCTRCDPVCFESIRGTEPEHCPDVVLELVMEKLNCIKLK